jgi:hypothetical protein
VERVTTGKIKPKAPIKYDNNNKRKVSKVKWIKEQVKEDSRERTTCRVPWVSKRKALGPARTLVAVKF